MMAFVHVCGGGQPVSEDFIISFSLLLSFLPLLGWEYYSSPAGGLREMWVWLFFCLAWGFRRYAKGVINLRLAES